ncbi:DUF1778 domain-containing protein [Photorhabdus namnaonensis]|uniref:Uncharacterized protein n=1 Tax=Photorhabdus namnaonensis TaxID=1851568 RepID=A0A1B8YE95_9GAMM|nr:DUF1778 domain-containing protein [Photorhabdus namnaonensis]OCA53474.1 hypothetical protein Phpb_03530 [Photorhabdus namnaonensis]
MATNTERQETYLEFLIASRMERASNVIERTETLHLSMVGANALFATLGNPPKANPKLLKAAKHYKDRVNVYNP